MQAQEISELLAGAQPFSGLPAQERESLARSFSLHRFGRGEIVFSEGDAAGCSWLVHSGRVRIVSYLSRSRLMQVELLGRGDLFGLFCRLGGERRTYPCTAMAEAETRAVRIQDEAFDRLFARYPPLAREACALCAKRLRSMQRLVCFGRESARQRVGELLLRFHRSSGSRIPATRQALAVQAGTALETVFRVLAFFRRRGWIATERGAIWMRNASALAAHLKGRQR